MSRTSVVMAVVKGRGGVSVLVGASLLLCPDAVVGQTGASTRPDFSRAKIAISKLSPNVYRLSAQDMPPGVTGQGGVIGVLAGPEGVLMVDSQFVPLTEKVIAAVKEVSVHPIRLLVNTHVHGDHTGGNERLGTMGVTILGREELRRRLLEPSTGGAPPRPMALPVITYSGPTTIHLNGEDVRLLPVPTAHTDGDTIVQFSKADIVMTGDLFRTIGYPIIDRLNGGTLPGLLAALDTIIQLCGPETQVVPGHGDVADRAAVIAYREMIIAVRDQIVPLVRRGMTLEQVLATKPTSSFDNRVRGWDGPVPGGGTTADRFVSQVYAELTAR